MTKFRTLDNLDVAGKRVIVRADLNVPMKNGRVTDATRLVRLAPTIGELAKKQARVVVVSHFGRPGGKVVPDMSLRPVAKALAEAMPGIAVHFAEDCVGPAATDAVERLRPGEVVVLENLRFHAGEESNDAAFAQALASLGDIYVNDAFSCAHRAHASTAAIARLLPAAAGRLMAEELSALARVLVAPKRPLAGVVGGAKISTKLELLGHLVNKVDRLIIGGAMANTFLNALGHDVGKSLCERDMAKAARDVMARAKAANCQILLPGDAVVAASLQPGEKTSIVAINKVPKDMMILDAGPMSIARLAYNLSLCRSVVWNGPLGAFEIPPYDVSTNMVARHVAALTKLGRIISVAGGGDTVAALAHAGVADDFSYVSTAGGAFLEWLEGKDLPGVAALKSA
ncbi:MAG: phosphoglycerate kinase [Alphaproteobacteria bacterium]